jgi:HPt (histidine-containing phosphotransfer) domain-containing protein
MPDTDLVLDPSALDELRACDPEGTGLLAELIDIYLADTPPRLNALRLAFDAGQPKALSSEAHALKSSSAQLGARALAEGCRRLEMLGREGSLAGVEQLLARVDADFQAVKAALLAVRG